MVHKSNTGEEMLETIDALRVLIKEESNLRCSMEDDYLIRFIKACHYDVQSAFLLIKDYFRARHDNPDEFQFKAPSSYKSTISRLDLGFVVHEKDNKGRPILVLRLGDVDPSRESWTLLMQSASITLESLSLEPECQDNGVTIIFDCTNFSLKIMKWATPHKLRVMMRFLQDCLPMRFEMFHVVNAPLVFNVFFSALRPFMNEGFVKRLNWHKYPFTTLHQLIKPSLLLPHMGGTLDLDEVRDWYKVVLNKEDYFKDYESMGYY